MHAEGHRVRGAGWPAEVWHAQSAALGVAGADQSEAFPRTPATPFEDSGRATRPEDSGRATRPEDSGRATRPEDSGRATRPRRSPRTYKASDDSDIKAAFARYARRNPDVHLALDTFVNWDAAFSKGQNAFVEAVRKTIASASPSDALQIATKDFEYDTRSALANRWLQTDPVADGLRHYLTEHQPEYLNELAQWTQRLIGAALLLPLHLGLALLISLLICLDAPNIMNRVRSIRNSRVRSFYDEIAPMLSNFGRLTGKALEAQFVIGALNTLLTIVVLLLLGVENIYFLSAIVFLSSIVPVIGALFACTVVFLMATPSTN